MRKPSARAGVTINSHKNHVSIIGRIAKPPETFHVKKTGELIAKIGVMVSAPEGRTWFDVKGYGAGADIILAQAKMDKTVLIEGSLIIEVNQVNGAYYKNAYIKMQIMRILEPLGEGDFSNPTHNNPFEK